MATIKKNIRPKRKSFPPFKYLNNSNKEFLELEDNSFYIYDPDTLFSLDGVDPRNKNSFVARLILQFINLNSKSLELFDTVIEQEFDGYKVALRIRTGEKVGACSLRSPKSGRYDLGLIIKPRYQWNGIGPTMSFIGWKTVPEILDMPMMKVSEKNIPPWVMSSIVLNRISLLIRKINRRFEFIEEDLNYPKGHVNWINYSTRKIGNAKFDSFNCVFPALATDKQIKGYIHFALLTQLQSLQSQFGQGNHVRKLVAFCLELISKVSESKPVKATSQNLDMLLKSAFSQIDFKKGVQAVDWTINEKGLAGLGDIGGVPWIMSMAALFENFVETLFEKYARLRGGFVRSGRNRETIIGINWERRSLGSQGYLLPDILYKQSDDKIYIVDAKYKNHWEDIVLRNWHGVEEEIRNAHRTDLFQILAYTAIHNVRMIYSCLIYPCKQETYQYLLENDRVISKASIVYAEKTINLRLIAISFDQNINDFSSLMDSI